MLQWIISFILCYTVRVTTAFRCCCEPSCMKTIQQCPPSPSQPSLVCSMPVCPPPACPPPTCPTATQRPLPMCPRRRSYCPKQLVLFHCSKTACPLLPPPPPCPAPACLLASPPVPCAACPLPPNPPPCPEPKCPLRPLQCPKSECPTPPLPAPCPNLSKSCPPCPSESKACSPAKCPEIPLPPSCPPPPSPEPCLSLPQPICPPNPPCSASEEPPLSKQCQVRVTRQDFALGHKCHKSNGCSTIAKKTTHIGRKSLSRNYSLRRLSRRHRMKKRARKAKVARRVSRSTDDIIVSLPKYEPDSVCNSELMRTLMLENLTEDVTSSKRTIRKVLEQNYKGKFNVICSEGEFAFLSYSNLRCQASNSYVTCYAFRAVIL